MALPILVIGRSGAGKSRSIKNLTGVGVIKVVNKELPFKSQIGCLHTTDYGKIKQALLKGEVDKFVIDDAGYLLTDEFMRRSAEKGYDKFTELAFNFYDLIQFINTQLPRHKRVYIVMHEEENDVTGQVKPKTIGKLLDEKISIEGLFTIVIRCVEHQFIVNNSGCAKSPEEMFESDTIENDLSIVDKAIVDYYNLEEDK